MADPVEGAAMDTASHDGRFGERFDDEISVPGIIWITIGLAVACALGMLITWGMQSYYAARAQAVQQPSPVVEANERRLPDGPLLQTDPEGELEAMRHELGERLGGYGWIDEASGVVHIPIDEAMGLLVEHGTVAASGGGAPEPAAAEESAP